jgi:hypothetical protein
MNMHPGQPTPRKMKKEDDDARCRCGFPLRHLQYIAGPNETKGPRATCQCQQQRLRRVTEDEEDLVTGRFPWFDRVDRPDVLGKRGRPTRYYVSRYNKQTFGDTSRWETWSEASRDAMRSLANGYIDAENARLEQVFLAQQRLEDSEHKTPTAPAQGMSTSVRFLSTNPDHAYSASIDVGSFGTSRVFGDEHHHQATPSQHQGSSIPQPHPSPPMYGASPQKSGFQSTGASSYPWRPAQSQPLHTTSPNNHSYPAPQYALNPRGSASNHHTEQGLRWIQDFTNAVPLLSQPEVFTALAAACMDISSSATAHLRRTGTPLRVHHSQPQHTQQQQTHMDERYFPPTPAAGNWADPQSHQPTVGSPPAYPGMYETELQFLNPTPSAVHNHPQSPMQGLRDSPFPLMLSPSPPPLPDPSEVFDDESTHSSEYWQHKHPGCMSATSAPSSEQKSAACHLCKSTQKLAQCTSGHGGKKQHRADNVAPCQTQNLAFCFTRICHLVLVLTFAL